MQPPNILENDNLGESLASILSAHCKDRQTGIVFVTTNDNKSCKIFLDNGEVSAISMRKYGGDAAPDELNRIGVKACSFSDRFTLPYPKNDEVTSSNDILNQLGCNAESMLRVVG